MAKRVVLPLLSMLSAVSVVLSSSVPAAASDEYEEGFRQRASRIIEFINTEGMRNRLDRPVWTDHTKYLWPVVLGILHQGPDHPRYEDAVQAMHTGSYEGTWIDEKHNKKTRYNREFFHFAGLGMARLLTQFEEVWDDEERRAVIDSAVPGHGGLKAFAIGTTNHRTMSITNSYLLTQEAMKLDVDGAEGLHRRARGQLLAFADRLFTSGMAEWDSSIYYAFTISGFMNVYDYADDPQIREVARAVLDFLAANAALKYTNGLWGGPESRGGSAYRGLNAISDYVAWLWFGDAERPVEEFSGGAAYAVHAALSSYRPHPALVAVARREVAVPFSSFGSSRSTGTGRSMSTRTFTPPIGDYGSRTVSRASKWCCPRITTYSGNR